MVDDPSNDETGSSRQDVGSSFPSSDSFSDGGQTSSVKAQASFARGLARTWIEEHQKETMMGAFAVGVFLGGLLRD